MKAIVYEKYGPPDVLQLKEVGKPAPKEGEVLLKVYAASVNWGDWHNLRADPFLVHPAAGLLKPKNQILGFDVAGRIEAVGINAKQFQPGFEVFGDIYPYGGGKWKMKPRYAVNDLPRFRGEIENQVFKWIQSDKEADE